jgi:hypothetical protein
MAKQTALHAGGELLGFGVGAGMLNAGGKVLDDGFGMFSSLARNGDDAISVGFLAPTSEGAEGIIENGFRTGTNPGRLGSGGVYLNDTIEGAAAEFAHYNPSLNPTTLRVQYQAGVNASTAVAPVGRRMNIPLNNIDSISAPSVRLPGTTNTHVLNGTAEAMEVVK